MFNLLSFFASDLILCSLDEEHRMNSSVPPVVREAWARQQRIQSLIGAGEGSNRFLNEHKGSLLSPSTMQYFGIHIPVSVTGKSFHHFPN